MSVAIKIENVSKLYRLGTVGTGTISHDLNRWWHLVRGKEDPYTLVGQVNDRTQSAPSPSSLEPSSSYVWALRDINLEVQQGEILGIIGRNGAGKSTLLKMLSRVTAPTQGTIKSKGRIASLLEVGTGFHPELTGRENIYLNGSILGMKKQEITKRLDEIVDFSGCAMYLDTPTKRYSSGMTVRLGFAVAAHLNCEILIVDEVLAVGDADFQKKSIGKMRNMHNEGRTVLFVTHQLAMVNAICDRAIVLEQGEIAFDGKTTDALMFYQPTGAAGQKPVFEASLDRGGIGDDRVRLIRAWTNNAEGQITRDFDISESVLISMEFEILRDDIPWPYPNFHVFDSNGNYVFVTSTLDYPNNTVTTKRGVYTATCEIPRNMLNTGTFGIGVAATCMDRGTQVAFWERDALAIQIVENLDETLETTRNGYAGPMPGAFRPQLNWKIVAESAAAIPSS